jgi:cob(I)alamin adenosyltransferase
MSISTKSGDTGETGLWSGERLWKDDLRVEAYGTIDELNSFLGEAKHYIRNVEIRKQVIDIQNDLFRVAGQLASKSKIFTEIIHEKDTENLTSLVEKYESQVKLSGFVIPGATLASAKLDICRTIARRAERRMIQLNKKESISPVLIQYINRLSDLIYIMARVLEKEENKLEEKKW